MNDWSSLVSFEEAGAVGIVRLNNPPVNALSHAVRTGLVAAVHQAAKLPTTKVLLIVGAGDLFCAGGDISEFDRPLEEPSLHVVEAVIERFHLPVVAAIHGMALGGGLELAMACHYRLVHKNARMGMPEINLGLIPGAGGTQRLPRIVGARASLNMILSGTPIAAEEARTCGLADEVVEGDLCEAAVAFCQQLVRDGRGPRPTCERKLSAGLDDTSVAETLEAHGRALRGRTTQALAIEAISAAALPFAQGMAVEARLSEQSIASRESAALRHMFFAERETTKGFLKSQEAKAQKAAQESIKRVAVIGAGTMGSGIAMAVADAGREVTLVDTTPAALVRSRETIQANYASSVKRGRLTQPAVDERVARITSGTSLADAASADVVIEAVFEDMELKRTVLAQIDSFLPPDRLIATNTSTLSVTDLGRSTAHPDRVVGLHFFVPANASRLLEIVRTGDTSSETLAAAFQVAKLLKKVPVVSGDAFGFIGNRMMLDGYFREAEQLLLEGASPMQVDTALERFGFAMGPHRVSDLAGNDVGTKARTQLYKRESRSDPYFVVADKLTELERLGQKTGCGFYLYEKGSREALPDPEVTTIIETLAAERNIVRREISELEIVERCILALINVGAMVLEEGIARRAADVDVVWAHGYGFPRYLGGPMFYADTLGLGHVAEHIRHYHKELGFYWKPAPLIERLAAANSNFEQWDQERH